jgi:F420-dependent oxidoreductase-like protein
LGKIKFGVFVPFYALNGKRESPFSLFDRLREITLECERLGYHSVWLDDHMMFDESPVLESWTVLSALAIVTTKIRLGTMVLCNSFRQPSVVAKMAATLDVISKGRLELGLGAGLQKDEHEAYGLPFFEPQARIGRLEEAVSIIRKMWAEEKPSYEGKYYKIREAVCEPKPFQKPHPPIVIGGGGEKLTLKVTAQHADRYDWGYLPSIEMYQHKLRVLKDYCREIGRDFREIEKSCWPWGQVLLNQKETDVDERAIHIKPGDVSMEDFKRDNLLGYSEECSQRIQSYVDLGVTNFMLFFGDFPNLEGLRIFADTILKET